MPVKLSTFVQNLREAYKLFESEAAEQAHEMGLVSAGWGRWKDNTGKVVAKTVGDKLVKTTDDDRGDEEDPNLTHVNPNDANDPDFDTLKKAGVNYTPGKGFELPDGNSADNFGKRAQLGGDVSKAYHRATTPKTDGTKYYKGRGFYSAKTDMEAHSRAQHMPALQKALKRTNGRLGDLMVAVQQDPRYKDLEMQFKNNIYRNADKIMSSFQDTELGRAAIERADGDTALFNSPGFKVFDAFVAGNDWPELVPEANEAISDGYELGPDQLIEMHDLCVGMAEELAQGRDPLKNPAIAEELVDWKQSVLNDIEYREEAKRDDMEPEERYVRRPYDRF